MRTVGLILLAILKLAVTLFVAVFMFIVRLAVGGR